VRAGRIGGALLQLIALIELPLGLLLLPNIPQNRPSIPLTAGFIIRLSIKLLYYPRYLFHVAGMLHRLPVAQASQIGRFAPRRVGSMLPE
jgi:hypothetical protein